MRNREQWKNWLTERLPESAHNRHLRLTGSRRENLWQVRQAASTRYLGSRTPKVIEGGEEESLFALDKMVYGHTTFLGLDMGGDLLGAVAEVSDVYFSYCTFQNCKMDNLRFTNCTFVGTVFQNVEFGRVTFEGCIFNEGSNPDLERDEDEATCFFNDCFLRGRYQGEWTLFNGCDLRWAVFARCDTDNIVLNCCNLTGNIWDGGRFRGLRLRGCNMKEMVVCGAERLDLYFENVDHCQVDETFYVDYTMYEEKWGRELEKSLRRVANLCRVHHLDDVAAEYIYRARCAEMPFLQGYRRLSAQMQHITCGYGERPTYTLNIIILHNFLFAFLYLFGGITADGGVIDYNLLGNHLGIGTVIADYFRCLFFSITTFTTVGYGNYLPLGTFSMVLTSIQMMLGLCLGALWTGCILRKISR